MKGVERFAGRVVSPADRQLAPRREPRFPFYGTAAANKHYPISGGIRPRALKPCGAAHANLLDEQAMSEIAAQREEEKRFNEALRMSLESQKQD